MILVPTVVEYTEVKYSEENFSSAPSSKHQQKSVQHCEIQIWERNFQKEVKKKETEVINASLSSFYVVMQVEGKNHAFLSLRAVCVPPSYITREAQVTSSYPQLSCWAHKTINVDSSSFSIHSKSMFNQTLVAVIQEYSALPVYRFSFPHTAQTFCF